jgi:hypothetical protein
VRFYEKVKNFEKLYLIFYRYDPYFLYIIQKLIGKKILSWRMVISAKRELDKVLKKLNEINKLLKGSSYGHHKKCLCG